MTTHSERFLQAHLNAVRLANAAYRTGQTVEQRSDLYYQAYTREMTAFAQLEAMRQPLPNQTEIDAESAGLLRDTYTIDA